MGDSSTRQFIRERLVSFRALPRRALLAAPGGFELARGVPTRERAEGSQLRGAPLEFLVPLTQFSCSGRSAHASSFAPEAIVQMSAAIPDGSSE
jgi:hypothetical protein